MSPNPVPLATTALLAAASSSFFLAGCGGGTLNTTPGPAPGPAPPPNSPDLPDSPDSPAPAPTPEDADDAPSQCCWSRWGTHYDCGNYPEGQNGGKCNNDVSRECNAPSDCSGLAPPSTTPPRETTASVWRRPTTTPLPDGACVKTDWSGCLNGESFIFAEHFVCGKGASVGIHKWGESSCCAQGLSYDPHEQFCCNSGLNRHTDGQCRDFDPHDDPVGCRCPSSSALATEVTEETEAAEGTVIDTQGEPNASPCLMAEGGMGCLNGFPFDPSSDTLCGQYIVKGDTHGCCPTSTGITTYNMQTQSCCQNGDSAYVRAGVHHCQCREWPNSHCSGSLFSTVV